MIFDSRDLWIIENGYIDPHAVIKTYSLSPSNYKTRHKRSRVRLFGDETKLLAISDLQQTLTEIFRIPDTFRPGTLCKIALVHSDGGRLRRLGIFPEDVAPVVGIVPLGYLQREILGTSGLVLKLVQKLGVRVPYEKRQTAGTISNLAIRAMILLAVRAWQGGRMVQGDRLLGERKREETEKLARLQTLKAIAYAPVSNTGVREERERRA